MPQNSIKITNTGNGIVVSGSQGVVVYSSHGIADEHQNAEQLIKELITLKEKYLLVQRALGVPADTNSIDEAINGIKSGDEGRFIKAIKRFSSLAISLAKELALNVLSNCITANL